LHAYSALRGLGPRSVRDSRTFLQEVIMAQAKQPKFKDMTFGQKCKHVGRVAIFLLSAGFIYPNILLD